MDMKLKKNLRNLLVYILLFLALVWSLAPIFFVALSSFRSVNEQYTTSSTLFPTNPTLESYRYVLSIEKVPRALINSTIVTIAGTIFAVLFGSLAGYSMSRFRTGGTGLSFLILLSRMIPTIALSVPLFFLGKTLDLIDKHFYLILVYTFLNLALATWMMKTFFDQLPIEIEESARVDGCTTWQLLRKIVFPLSAPGMSATAVVSFIACWNEFGFALVLTRSNALTLPVVTSNFVTQFIWEWGYMAAAAMLLAVPAILFALISQKYLVQGLSFGALN